MSKEIVTQDPENAIEAPARKKRRANRAPYPDGSIEREAWEAGYRCGVKRRS